MKPAIYIHGTTQSEQERLAALNRANNPFFLEFLDIGPARSVLEVGCGMGILTADVARSAPGARVVGLEFSAEQLARAPRPESGGPGNLSFVEGDAHALPFADQSFDVVYCRFLLEHVTDPVRVLREMRRVLSPGGRAFVQENNILMCDFDPDCAMFERVWRCFAELQRALGGDALIGKRLYRLMRQAGFEEVRLSIQPEIHRSGQPAFEPWVRNLIGNIRSGEARLVESGLASAAQIAGAIGELEAFLGRDDATALFYWNRAIGSA
ncbi:MAG: methyltransferase domain-containing protein [Planctomycetota bacterium]|nr:methyltransferase domain-containing protein [Planctomycetota bacterium]